MASDWQSPFSVQLQKFCDRAKVDLDVAVRKITLGIFSDVILMSPADTGRFRGNWQVTVGQPAAGVLPVLDPGGSATVQATTDAVGLTHYGGVVYMTNNLPYARRLEYGWSKQAPAGMVRVTLARYRDYVDRVVAQ